MASQKPPARANRSERIDRSEYMKRVHRFRNLVVYVLIGSIAVFLGISVVFGGIGKVAGEIGSINPWIYSLAFACVFASYLVRFGKWSFYLRMLKVRISWWESFSIYMSLGSMNITPGRVGRILGGYTLEKVSGKKFMNVAPAITMDIFADFLGFAFFAGITAILFHKFIIYILFIILLLSISFWIVLDDRFYRWLSKGRGGIFRRFTPHANMYFKSQGALNKRWIYAFSFVYTLPADFLNSLALYFTLLAFGIHPSLGVVIFIFATAHIFGMASFVPGSIGVTDVTIVILSETAFGISSALSAAVAILTRLATLWFVVGLGALFLFYTMRYWTKAEANERKNKALVKAKTSERKIN